ncbi:MAG: hypothetical protein J1E78_03285 [Muribaculaceae bacterium]|nr:hypothetical protein [Muribaculaceae bacterium]
MKGDKDVKISYWAAHLTTIVSVTLVLLLAGIIALICLSSERETRRLREKIEVSLIMRDSVSDHYAAAVASKIADYPFSLNTGFINKEQALTDWKTETGEDLEALFGVNPLSPEIYFHVKAEYASADSLKKIESRLRQIPGVEDVALPNTEMLQAMNDNIQSLAIILGIVALFMVLISFVLINNTVHLTIYARRFTIHTMQLVGATKGFITRPFVANNMLAGLISGLIAAGITAIALAAAPHAGWNDVAHYISWWIYACVAGGMVIAGPCICGIAAKFATLRFLKKDYDELF